jgi:hypothetical protein
MKTGTRFAWNCMAQMGRWMVLALSATSALAQTGAECPAGVAGTPRSGFYGNLAQPEQIWYVEASSDASQARLSWFTLQNVKSAGTAQTRPQREARWFKTPVLTVEKGAAKGQLLMPIKRPESALEFAHGGQWMNAGQVSAAFVGASLKIDLDFNGVSADLRGVREREQAAFAVKGSDSAEKNDVLMPPLKATLCLEPMVLDDRTAQRSAVNGSWVRFDKNRDTAASNGAGFLPSSSADGAALLVQEGLLASTGTNAVRRQLSINLWHSFDTDGAPKWYLGTVASGATDAPATEVALFDPMLPGTVGACFSLECGAPEVARLTRVVSNAATLSASLKAPRSELLAVPEAQRAGWQRVSSELTREAIRELRSASLASLSVGARGGCTLVGSNTFLMDDQSTYCNIALVAQYPKRETWRLERYVAEVGTKALTIEPFETIDTVVPSGSVVPYIYSLIPSDPAAATISVSVYVLARHDNQLSVAPPVWPGSGVDLLNRCGNSTEAQNAGALYLPVEAGPLLGGEWQPGDFRFYAPGGNILFNETNRYPHTGFNFDYRRINGDDRVRVTWHTFDSLKRPVWLQSEWVSMAQGANVPGQGNAISGRMRAILRRYSWSPEFKMRTNGVPVGEIIFDRKTDRAIYVHSYRWLQTDAGAPGAVAGAYISFVGQCYVARTPNYGRGQKNATPAHTGSWTNHHSPYVGAQEQVDMSLIDDENGGQFDGIKVRIFDAQHNPIWLSATGGSAASTPRPLDATYTLNYLRSPYEGGIPGGSWVFWNAAQLEWGTTIPAPSGNRHYPCAAPAGLLRRVFNINGDTSAAHISLQVNLPANYAAPR